jgi:sugar phosphate isomerase/epimerase
MTAPLSVQLWSLGSAPAADPAGTVARLASLGFGAVEPVIGTGGEAVRDWVKKTYGYDMPPSIDTTALKRALAEHGMIAPSSHVTLPEGPRANQILDEQEMLGCKYLVLPSLFDAETGAFETFDNLDRIKVIAERFNLASENARARGMRVGYHNHSQELTADFDGRSWLEALFEIVEPDVFAEVDMYWVQVGGRDPVQVVKSLGDRVLLLHVKDGNTATPEGPSLPIGEGGIDVPSVLAAAPSAQMHVIELENLSESDVWPVLEQSRRYLLDNGLSR